MSIEMNPAVEPKTVADLIQVVNQTKAAPAKPEEPKQALTEVVAEEVPTVQESAPQVEPPKTPSANRERKRNKPVVRYKNEVRFRGTIAKIIESKSVTIVTMAVKATMTISNYPTIMFFGNTKEQVKPFKEGDRVYVIAALQSYDESKLRKDQSPVLTVGQKMMAESDAPISAQMFDDDLGLKPIENAYCNDENEIEIRGQILAIECSKNNNVTLTIRTIIGGRQSIIKYPYYARNVNHFLKNVYVHQFVRAIGTVQTANIPVEATDETRQVRAQMIENATSIRAPEPDKRLKTKKKQFYILYDVYVVN